MDIRKTIVVALALAVCAAAAGKREKRAVVRMETTEGVIRIALLDETPLHRDNFLRLVGQGYYDNMPFHRVIKDFMIQAGEGDDPGYTLPAEICLPYYYHLRGMVAAAREDDDVNPQRRSSATQFYIVWGKTLGPSSIRKAREQLAEQDVEMTAEMVSNYEQYGGTPHLDGQYTVFGQVIEGLDVVKRIQQQPTDTTDRPLTPILITRAVAE